MGGHAFVGPGGRSLSSPIKKQNVQATLTSFHGNVLRPAGIESYMTIGSAGVKSISGDIDVAVGPIETSKTSRDLLLKKIKQSVGNDVAKLVGSNIAVLYPIVSQPDELVQIDLMLSNDPVKTAWLMSGTATGVKGIYRNLLLAYIAKLRSTQTKKVTISFPGGIQVVENGDVVVDRTEDPWVVIDELGIGSSPKKISTFEDLVITLASHPKLSKSLIDFDQYIGHFLRNPNTKDEAMKALTFIRQLLDLRESTKQLLNIING